jgi:hypothetical protein
MGMSAVKINRLENTKTAVVELDPVASAKEVGIRTAARRRRFPLI